MNRYIPTYIKPYDGASIVARSKATAKKRAARYSRAMTSLAATLSRPKDGDIEKDYGIIRKGGDDEIIEGRGGFKPHPGP